MTRRTSHAARWLPPRSPLPATGPGLILTRPGGTPGGGAHGESDLSAYVLFDLYGKELSLTLEGRLSVQDGYLRLSPTRLMLGSLPGAEPARPPGVKDPTAQAMIRTRL